MIERVLDLWNNGFSEYEIAKKFDVPVKTIQMILIQNGQYYGDY